MITLSDMNLLFLGNIRGWQLIIILMVLLLPLVLSFLFGLVVGRSGKHRGKKK